jgi:transposase
MRNHGRTTSTKADSFRRIEVITGVGRDAALVGRGEGLDRGREPRPGDDVSAVARRYGLHASQLFVWRQRLGGTGGARALEFVPVVVEEGAATPAEVAAGWRSRSAGRGARRPRMSTLARCAGARGGAGPGVIAVPPGVRILLAAQPVDFRKGMDGLAPGAAGAPRRPVRRGGLHLPPQRPS